MYIKRNMLLMIMIGLVMAAVYGLFVYGTSIKQASAILMPIYVMPSQHFKTNKADCQLSGIQPMDILYFHFPDPTTFSRDECTCTPVQFFAILSMQRSGSGWFETLLNSHINISSNGEIFKVRERRSNTSSLLKTLDDVYSLEWISSATKETCTAAVGFKWMLNQGVLKYHQEVVNYFNLKGVSVIFLLRKNLLSRMISILANSFDMEAKQINGTHKSHVHSQDEGKILAQYKPTVNINSLLSDLGNAKEMASIALEYFKSTRHMTLYYEDIINNHTKLLDVMDFLRVPRRDLQSNHVKIHTKPLKEQVENWDDVLSTLKGTEYLQYALHS